MTNLPVLYELRTFFCLLYGVYFFLCILSFVSLKDFIFNIFQIGKLYSGFVLSRPEINDTIRKIGDMLAKTKKEKNDV